MTVKSLSQVKDTVIELLPENFGPIEGRAMGEAGIKGTGRPVMVDEVKAGHLITVANVAEDVYNNTGSPSLILLWAGIAYEIRVFQAGIAEARGDFYTAYLDQLGAFRAKTRLVGIQGGKTRTNKKRRLYEEAYPHIIRAAEFMEKLIESGKRNKMECARDACDVNSRAGSVAMKLGRFNEAYGHYSRSVEHAKTLSEELPEPEKREYRKVMSYQNGFAGDALMKLGRFEEAYGRFKDSIGEISELSKTASKSELAGYNSYICYQTGFMADAAASMGRFDEAFRLYNRSALLAQGLAGESKVERKIKYIEQACYMYNRAGKSANRMLEKPDLPDSERNLWRVHYNESFERAHRILGSLDESLSRSGEIEKLRLMMDYDPVHPPKQTAGKVWKKTV